jgi:hypothetical protein
MRHTALLLAAFVAVGCVRTSTNPATGKVDVDVESPTKTGEDWKARIAGVGSYASLTGNSTVLVNKGAMSARINLMGGDQGSRHPWHVHEGKCGTGGPIVGNPAAYPPLVVTSDGKATASADLTVALKEAMDYHVNVHESSTNMANIIACGNLDD